ncbi:MAG: oligosaccharide flippase family protein [Phycisphaerae bacterium]|nr:oligosaccharide flippase family protein [Phycisphaerae bacterium]
MPKPPITQALSPGQDRKGEEDLTGRDLLVSNVVFSWAAHFVFIIAGFILPRMIDRRLGQELLGVWDFGWSLVSYFGLVQAGVGSSVNRYIAKYRAAGDISGVNRIASTAFCIQNLAGMLVFGLTIAVSLLLPQLFGARLGENVVDAQWVVFFLGASMGIQMCFAVFAGVLTGCHRWKLHNIIKSGWHAATVAGMIVALLMGAGLPSLAGIVFAGLVLGGVTRVLLAHRVCEGLRLRPSLVGWRTIKKLFIFGGKTLIPSVSNLLLNQTTSVLIVAFLGPAALALFARPRSLVRHMNTLINKMAMTLTPTAGSLQSTGNLKEIRELLITSVRYSLYMVLPMVLVLIVFGGAIMQFWMGPRYANALIPAILAAGYLTTMVQLPVLSILAGLNAHGRAGIAQFIASLCTAGLTVLVLRGLGLGLVGTAVAVTLPLTIMNVTYLPFLICRRVNLDMRRYFLAVTAGPAVHVLPFAICLVVARLVFKAEPLMGLLWGGAIGGAVLAVLYWRYVLPDRIKARISCSKLVTAFKAD